MVAAAAPLKVTGQASLTDFVGFMDRPIGHFIIGRGSVIDDTDGIFLHPVNTLVSRRSSVQFTAILGTRLGAVLIAR